MVVNKKYCRSIPVMQPDAVIDLAPASGVKNPVLTLTRNVRLISIRVQCTWTVQPDPLEVHAQVDGITYKWTKTNPVSGTNYYCLLEAVYDEAGQLLSATDERSRPFLLDCRKLEVSAEVTGGTVSNMKCRIKHGVF